MIKITQEEADEVVRLHGLWLEGKPTGERANFRGKDLSGLDFRGADLWLANFSRVNLSNVSFFLAYLNNADLSCADLRR